MKIINIAGKIIASPYGLLIISFMVLFIGHYIFKRTFMNCFDVVKKHICGFKKKNGKISYLSLILYFGVPFLIALSLSRIRNIDGEVINILTVIISILTSMFFTLLALILDLREKIRRNEEYDASEASISRTLLKETYYALMFEIFVSIIILIMCFVELFAKKFSYIWGLLLYYFSFVMLMNLFIILKRIYRVIDNDLENN